MKIIAIKWRAGSSDFVHVICNDDVADTQYKRLRKADTLAQFDIAVFSPDQFIDALNYVESETESLAKEVGK